MTPITEIINKIIISLNLNQEDKTKLNDIIQDKITKKEIEANVDITPELQEKLDGINNGNDKMKTFETTYMKQYTANTNKNFNSLKYNLGKLQVMILINKIKKATDNSMILDTILDALNNTMGTMGNMLDMNLTGGGIHDDLKKLLHGINGHIIGHPEYIRIKEIINHSDNKEELNKELQELEEFDKKIAKIPKGNLILPHDIKKKLESMNFNILLLRLLQFDNVLLDPKKKESLKPFFDKFKYIYMIMNSHEHKQPTTVTPKHDAPKHDAPKHDAPKHDAPKPEHSDEERKKIRQAIKIEQLKQKNQKTESQINFPHIEKRLSEIDKINYIQKTTKDIEPIINELDDFSKKLSKLSNKDHKTLISTNTTLLKKLKSTNIQKEKCVTKSIENHDRDHFRCLIERIFNDKYKRPEDMKADIIVLNNNPKSEPFKHGFEDFVHLMAKNKVNLATIQEKFKKISTDQNYDEKYYKDGKPLRGGFIHIASFSLPLSQKKYMKYKNKYLKLKQILGL